MRPHALDLFCGAGGASMGLHRAGFDVLGVDIHPQPHYPFPFVQADALTMLAEPGSGRVFDLVWASPPCQRFSRFSRGTGTHEKHLDLIQAVRDRLHRCGAALTIIENVVGAPFESSVMLCGSMFGLAVQRHRLFECTFIVGPTPPCAHDGRSIPVYGNGTPRWYEHGTDGSGKKWREGRGKLTLDVKRAAMGIDWMNRDELSQAIPPAYAQFLGEVVMRHLGR